MNISPQSWIRSLHQSRFFTISVFLHLLLLVTLGGVVIFKEVTKAPEFVSEGASFVTGTSDEEAATGPEGTEEFAVANEDASSSPATEASFSLAPSSVASVLTSAPTGAQQTFSLPASTSNVQSLGTRLDNRTPSSAASGAAGFQKLPSAMGGRSGSDRAAALLKGGGKAEGEQAVMNALRWLKKTQNPDGSWGKQYRGAMTGLALLSFLGHGETPARSQEFGDTVGRAIDVLIAEGTKAGGKLTLSQGGFAGNPAVYQHGIATYALAEAYTMTKDDRILPLLEKALEHILNGQASDGGWMYSFSKQMPSDTSVSGWMIQALKASKLAEVKNPNIDAALENAVKNLERVWDLKTGFVGYRKIGDRKHQLTGVGVLCKLFIEGKSDKYVREGIRAIFDGPRVDYKDAAADLYTWYYNTQACFQAQGSTWSRWNRMFQDEIIRSQSPDGAWPPHGGKEHGNMNSAEIDAQVYRTTLCILMLEVYYRYLPTSKHAAGS